MVKGILYTILLNGGGLLVIGDGDSWIDITFHTQCWLCNHSKYTVAFKYVMVAEPYTIQVHLFFLNFSFRYCIQDKTLQRCAKIFTKITFCS